jgi:hypothetical protein
VELRRAQPSGAGAEGAMSDVGYVVAAWASTGALLALYALRVAQRTRQARRSLPPDDPRR